MAAAPTIAVHNYEVPVDLEAGEQTPLILPGDAAGAQQMEIPDGSGSGGTMSMMKDDSVKEKAVMGVAGLGVVTSAVSMIISGGNPVVLVSGALGLTLSPYAAFQQTKLTQVQALAETNAAMDVQVGRLQAENKRLEQQVQDMGASIAKLKDMEKTLDMLNAVQGASIEELENQVEESRTILKKIGKNYQAEVLQNLTTVLLSSDSDGDMMLSDDEIDEMVERLEAIRGVRLNEALFRKMVVDQGRSVLAVMEVARDLLTSEENPGKEHIFSFVDQ